MYVVTVEMSTAYGLRIYNDLAYYKSETARWFAYNSAQNIILTEKDLSRNILTFLDVVIEVHK